MPDSIDSKPADSAISRAVGKKIRTAALSEDEQKQQRIQNTWTFIIWMIMVGSLFVLASSFRQFGDGSNLGNTTWLSRFGNGLLLAGACFSGGGLLGFIFGIPSFAQLPESRMKYNDNLVQISDWLTKIIVGVGLTQLYHIPQKVMSLGDYLTPSFGGDWISRNIALTIFFYWLILGFLAIFFWTKTDYTLMMNSTDKDLQQAREEKAVAEGKASEAIKEKAVAEAGKQTAVAEKLAAEVGKQAAEMSTSMAEAEIRKINSVNPELSTQLAKQLSDQIKNTPFDATGDPEKGKWGGQSEANGRKLTAIVRETVSNSELFNIALKVESTDPSVPLKGEVIFHIHPTFGESIITIKPENGIASLVLPVAYGAFTVGVECTDNGARLELDLAELPDAPKLFKER